VNYLTHTIDSWCKVYLLTGTAVTSCTTLTNYPVAEPGMLIKFIVQFPNQRNI